MATEDGGAPAAEVIVKWRGNDYRIPLRATDTVDDLQQAVSAATGVGPKRQKLLGLPKGGADDAPLVARPGLKPGHRLMMMGSPEEEHTALAAAEAAGLEAQATVLDDLADIDTADAPHVSAHPDYLAKIEQRVRTYKPKVLAGPREGKRCLVLDVDYTLFDHRSPAESARELGRPYLHEFLAAAYEHWDLVIWSATSMRWIELKMGELGVLDHPVYKLAMLVCSSAMVTVHTERYGAIEVKPLGVLWGQFPAHYTPANTLHIDDLSRNFLMNPGSGLKIRPCRGMTIAANREADDELERLTRYLDLLVRDGDDLSTADHARWERRLRHGARAAPRTAEPPPAPPAREDPASGGN